MLQWSASIGSPIIHPTPNLPLISSYWWSSHSSLCKGSNGTNLEEGCVTHESLANAAAGYTPHCCGSQGIPRKSCSWHRKATGGHKLPKTGIQPVSRVRGGGLFWRMTSAPPIFTSSAMDIALWGKLSTGWTSQRPFWIPEGLTTSYG